MRLHILRFVSVLCVGFFFAHIQYICLLSDRRRGRPRFFVRVAAAIPFETNFFYCNSFLCQTRRDHKTLLLCAVICTFLLLLLLPFLHTRRNWRDETSRLSLWPAAKMKTSQKRDTQKSKKHVCITYGEEHTLDILQGKASQTKKPMRRELKHSSSSSKSLLKIVTL